MGRWRRLLEAIVIWDVLGLAAIAAVLVFGAVMGVVAIARALT